MEGLFNEAVLYSLSRLQLPDCTLYTSSTFETSGQAIRRRWWPPLCQGSAVTSLSIAVPVHQRVELPSFELKWMHSNLLLNWAAILTECDYRILRFILFKLVCFAHACAKCTRLSFFLPCTISQAKSLCTRLVLDPPRQACAGMAWHQQRTCRCVVSYN